MVTFFMPVGTPRPRDRAAASARGASGDQHVHVRGSGAGAAAYAAPVPAVTPMAGVPTYLVMELMDDPLLSLFAAWRAEINSVPFAHEAECDKIVRALLGSCSQWDGGSCVQ
jgi:hypothetical protein